MTTLHAADLRAMFDRIAENVAQNRDRLNRLDSALGDGDHGTGMNTAFTAAAAAIHELTEPQPADILKTVALTLMNEVGGASGALFGTLFLKAALIVTGKSELTKADFDAMLAAGLQGVKDRGKADVGDKTMIDALAPAVDAYRQADDWAAAHAAAAVAARHGAESTVALIAKHGRARYTAERSVGHQDAGATTIQLIFEAMHTYWEGRT